MNNHKRNSFLSYLGGKAVILVEFQVLNTRTANLKLENQNDIIEFSLNQLEEKRNKPFINMATYR